MYRFHCLIKNVEVKKIPCVQDLVDILVQEFQVFFKCSVKGMTGDKYQNYTMQVAKLSAMPPPNPLLISEQCSLHNEE